MKIEDMLDKCTTDGWLSFQEAVLLMKAAVSTEGTIVEVGTYQGRSASLLAQTGRPVVCVDSWDDKFNTDKSGDEIYVRLLENIKGFPNIQLVRSRIEDWKPIPAGFVYLDGDHTMEGTRVQIQKALGCNPKAIAIHDVGDRGGGVIVKETAVAMLGQWQDRIESLAVWYLV